MTVALIQSNCGADAGHDLIGDFIGAFSAAGEDVFAYPESLRHFDNIAADIFHLLRILRLDGDETVRHQSAKVERSNSTPIIAMMRTAGGGGMGKSK